MLNYLNDGGGFMYFLAVFLLIIIGLAVKQIIGIYQHKKHNTGHPLRGVDAILFWGVMSLVTGILGHFIGLQYLTETIAKKPDITEMGLRMNAGGYGATLHAVIFGSLILIFSLIIWYAFKLVNKQY